MGAKEAEKVAEELADSWAGSQALVRLAAEAWG